MRQWHVQVITLDYVCVCLQAQTNNDHVVTSLYRGRKTSVCFEKSNLNQNLKKIYL